MKSFWDLRPSQVWGVSTLAVEWIEISLQKLRSLASNVSTLAVEWIEI
mgnify:CR=1 FL=1